MMVGDDVRVTAPQLPSLLPYFVNTFDVSSNAVTGTWPNTWSLTGNKDLVSIDISCVPRAGVSVIACLCARSLRVIG